jgi:hypothetical protein
MSGLGVAGVSLGIESHEHRAQPRLDRQRDIQVCGELARQILINLDRDRDRGHSGRPLGVRGLKFQDGIAMKFFLGRQHASGRGDLFSEAGELAGNRLSVPPLPWIRSAAARRDPLAAVLLVARAELAQPGRQPVGVAEDFVKPAD